MRGKAMTAPGVNAAVNPDDSVRGPEAAEGAATSYNVIKEQTNGMNNP